MTPRWQGILAPGCITCHDASPSSVAPGAGLLHRMHAGSVAQDSVGSSSPADIVSARRSAAEPVLTDGSPAGLPSQQGPRWPRARLAVERKRARHVRGFSWPGQPGVVTAGSPRLTNAPYAARCRPRHSQGWKHRSLPVWTPAPPSVTCKTPSATPNPAPPAATTAPAANSTDPPATPSPPTSPRRGVTPNHAVAGFMVPIEVGALLGASKLTRRACAASSRVISCWRARRCRPGLAGVSSSWRCVSSWVSVAFLVRRFAASTANRAPTSAGRGEPGPIVGPAQALAMIHTSRPSLGSTGSVSML